MLRRNLEPSEFSLSDQIVILAGHKDQVRTIMRVLNETLHHYNQAVKDKTKWFKDSEFPYVTTIHDYQGRDAMIAWDHVISHMRIGSDIGFYKDGRRSNFARQIHTNLYA
jgi:hypothetical protein